MIFELTQMCSYTCYVLIVVVDKSVLVSYHLHFVFYSEMFPKVVAVPEDDCCTELNKIFYHLQILSR